MGKGDSRRKRGKIFRGTFGKTRKHKLPSTVVVPVAKAKPAAVEPAAEAPKKKKAAKKKAE